MGSFALDERILNRPIPDLSYARVLRARGYQNIQLYEGHPLADDPLIALSEYGVASQSYYSRPNSTGGPVPGVKPEVLVRKDIAERLARVNEYLKTMDFLTRHFGDVVELFVDDGLRSIGLQKLVHDEIYPAYLRRTNPEWSEEEVLAKRDKRVAIPSPASPHASGGAVDVKLRVVDGTHIHYGRDPKIQETINTDYFETHDGEGAQVFRVNRRVVFHMLTAAGLVNNPEEVWHFGRGDRLSHVVSPEVTPQGLLVPAYYAAVDGSPELEA